MGTLTNNQKSVAIGNWGLDYDELGKEDVGFMNSSNSFTERQINKCLGKGVGQVCSKISCSHFFSAADFIFVSVRRSSRSSS